MRTALTILISLVLSTAAFADAHPLTGKWTYRSFHNRPDVIVWADEATAAQTALRLIFGEGIITLNVAEDGAVTGALDLGPSYALDMAGVARCGSDGAPASIELTGTGRDGTPTAGWEYKYVAYLAPVWSTGVRQVPSLVGTALRSKQHGNALPGYTVSFIAVRQPDASR